MGAKIYNSNLTKEIVDGAKLQLSQGQIPSELAEKVIPVMEVNPKLLRIANIVKSTSATNSTSAIIYTTPTDKDFYLTGANISNIKSALSTSTFSAINVILKGANVSNILLNLTGITLTAANGAYSQNFIPPILLKRGSEITITNSTNVAEIKSSGQIIGYEVDNITA
jgi:hypothetical protein